MKRFKTLKSYTLYTLLVAFLFCSCDEITKEEIKIGDKKCNCHEGVKDYYSDLNSTRVRCNDGNTFVCD